MESKENTFSVMFFKLKKLRINLRYFMFFTL